MHGNHVCKIKRAMSPMWLHVEREHVTYVGEERRTSTTFALTVLTTGGARHTRWGTGQVPTRSRALEHIRSHSGCPGRCRQNVLWVGTTPYTRCRTHRSEPPSTCDGARRSARTFTSKRSICTCAVGACDWSAQPSCSMAVQDSGERYLASQRQQQQAVTGPCARGHAVPNSLPGARHDAEPPL